MARRLFKTILVAIEYPYERRQTGLTKAAQLAKRLGARLTLFHCAFTPDAVGAHFHRGTLEQGTKKTLAARRAALEKLAQPLRRRGLKVAVQVLWDYPAFEGIVREVLRSKPDLVVAESHRHKFGARFFLTNNDWQLIRLCPAPLLFVKNTSVYGKARVLAAIDPMHAHAKPARLDERILEVAQSLTAAHAGRLDIAHAYLPLSSYMATAFGEPLVVPMDPQVERSHELNVKRAVDRIIAPLDLPPRQLHVNMGDSRSLICELAKRLRTDVVVMGAASRRGLERIFIGNTAERVIDQLPCDVLVVKPARFKTPVSRRTKPAQLLLSPI